MTRSSRGRRVRAVRLPGGRCAAATPTTGPLPDHGSWASGRVGALGRGRADLLGPMLRWRYAAVRRWLETGGTLPPGRPPCHGRVGHRALAAPTWSLLSASAHSSSGCAARILTSFVPQWRTSADPARVALSSTRHDGATDLTAPARDRRPDRLGQERARTRGRRGDRRRDRVGGRLRGLRGLDIGTDKPRAEARRRVRHHLIDIARPAPALLRRSVRHRRDRGDRRHPGAGRSSDGAANSLLCPAPLLRPCSTSPRPTPLCRPARRRVGPEPGRYGGSLRAVDPAAGPDRGLRPPARAPRARGLGGDRGADLRALAAARIAAFLPCAVRRAAAGPARSLC